MSAPAPILKEIHRLRRHTQNLKSEIDRGPRLLKAQQGKVANREESVKETHEAVKKLKVASHEKEVLLKATLQQIDKHTKQLNEAAGKKEYDALQAEIAADKKKV